jgi:hypothetical protein
MKKIFNISIFLLIILVMSFLQTINCGIYGIVNGPVNGLLYTDIKFAGEINPSNNVKSLKMAEGCIHGILYLFAYGEAGAGSIAKKSGITRIARVDHTATNVLYFYTGYCTIVYGE